ncbi:unnamed protein product [Soboliphyme baturini]|uniref:Peptidase S1 domain-containing protein n=1 Tax=Soboliphyme baturini TaxID=241478 RepID=A0A183J658_9BILA|nr:unnamed protein product [Soboliphyme baturini]
MQNAVSRNQAPFCLNRYVYLRRNEVLIPCSAYLVQWLQIKLSNSPNTLMAIISTLVVVYASLLTLDWTTDQVQANELCEEHCGRTSRWKTCLSRHRIMKGDPVSKPWLGIIEMTDDEHSVIHCSASLVCISNELAMATASHCFPDGIRTVKIFLSACDITDPSKHCFMSDFYSIVTKKRSLKLPFKANDIAIVRLADENLPKGVTPLCMPEKKDRWKAGDQAEVFGYGLDTTPGVKTPMLPRTATYILNSTRQCKQRYTTISDFEDKYEVCGYPEDPSKTISEGDSGGPVVRKNTLLAITLRSSEDPAFASNTIFTDVVGNTPWLKKAMEALPHVRKHAIYHL